MQVGQAPVAHNTMTIGVKARALLSFSYPWFLYGFDETLDFGSFKGGL